MSKKVVNKLELNQVLDTGVNIDIQLVYDLLSYDGSEFDNETIRSRKQIHHMQNELTKLQQIIKVSLFAQDDTHFKLRPTLEQILAIQHSAKYILTCLTGSEFDFMREFVAILDLMVYARACFGHQY